jgi:hypothetical protein
MIVRILETLELAHKGKGNYNLLFPAGVRVAAEKKVMKVSQVYYINVNEKNLFDINNGWVPLDSDCWRRPLDEIISAVKVHPFNHLYIPSNRIVYINKNVVSACTSWIINILSDKKWITITDIEILLYRYIDSSPSHFNVVTYNTISLELQFFIASPVTKRSFIEGLTDKISEYSA